MREGLRIDLKPAECWKRALGGLFFVCFGFRGMDIEYRGCIGWLVMRMEFFAWVCCICLFWVYIVVERIEFFQLEALEQAMMKEFTLKSFEESILSAELDAIRDMLRENGDAVREFFDRQMERHPSKLKFTERCGVVTGFETDGRITHGVGVQENGFCIMACVGDDRVYVSTLGGMVDAYRHARGLDSLDKCMAFVDAVRFFGRELAKFVAMANEAMALDEELKIG